MNQWTVSGLQIEDRRPEVRAHQHGQPGGSPIPSVNWSMDRSQETNNWTKTWQRKLKRRTANVIWRIVDDTLIETEDPALHRRFK
ncbi:hypothetical protein HAX54_044846 [Datura stramonium]|uniref:Uncharacterized protein n=1 Tax=Datura stramonium TaxID=4076 RepID=A0ABS8WJ82_DATST|nr:hypothetical protein [Datura stramonium]